MKKYWNRTDKCQHFIGGLIITQAVAAFTTLVIGLCVGVIVGILKEVWDYYQLHRHCDAVDAAATILGSCLGFVLGWGLVL